MSDVSWIIVIFMSCIILYLMIKDLLRYKAKHIKKIDGLKVSQMQGYSQIVGPMVGSRAALGLLTTREKIREKLQSEYFRIDQEVRNLVDKIDIAIASGDAYLWQDNINNTARCIVIQDSYISGDNDNLTTSEQEKTVDVINFHPIWIELKELLIGREVSDE